ncbi:hypothetical protein BIW11_07195 [Tropilaelaps mercedesae]|uniref:Uncharacterized protein n=1 Tax=Tropilaelaps mercedesae TaxID=418985 RepID=A0A1V9XVA8_9ACAR|nr:hypothetical protein BIW11_07195 [Tropilaelaps mercedesae]
MRASARASCSRRRDRASTDAKTGKNEREADVRGVVRKWWQSVGPPTERRRSRRPVSSAGECAIALVAAWPRTPSPRSQTAKLANSSI